MAGKFYYDQKKKFYFVVAGKVYYDRKKNIFSRLSGRLCCYVSFWFWQLRPKKKKVLVVCLAGCAVESVLGSGGK